MATGPEHYGRAERALDLAVEIGYNARNSDTQLTPDERDKVAWLTAFAQVNATLALAAATALGPEQPAYDWDAWRTIGAMTTPAAPTDDEASA